MGRSQMGRDASRRTGGTGGSGSGNVSQITSTGGTIAVSPAAGTGVVNVEVAYGAVAPPVIAAASAAGVASSAARSDHTHGGVAQVTSTGGTVTVSVGGTGVVNVEVSATGAVTSLTNADGSITLSAGVGAVVVSVSGLYPGAQYRFGGARGAYVISTANDNASFAQSASWAAGVWTAQATAVTVFESSAGTFNWYVNSGIVSGNPFVPFRVLSLDPNGVLRMGGGTGDFTAGTLPQGYQHQQASGGMLALGATPANAAAGAPLGRILVWNGTDRVGGLNFTSPTSATGGQFFLEVKPSGAAIRTAFTAIGNANVANDSSFGFGNATTISVWNGAGSTLEGPASSIAFGNTTACDLNLTSNAYFQTPNWKRKRANLACNISLAVGDITLRVAATGAVDSNITWISAVTVKAVGDVYIGTAALATNATAGFLMMPASAGPPTGAPTIPAGMAAWTYDSTNSKIYVRFSGGAWQSTAALT